MDETEKVLAKRELGKRDQNERNAIFFSLLSTVVGLGVTTNATTENEMFLLFATGATQAMESFHLKEYTTTVIFASTDHNTWPPGFVDFLSMKQADAPSDKWCVDRGIAEKSDNVKKLHYYGHRLLTSFKAAKTYICNVLNPIWNLLPAIVPSGVLQSTLFDWLRSRAWPSEATEMVKNTIRQKHKRMYPNAKYNQDNYAEEIADGISKCIFSPLWFPEHWLVFIYYGLPSKTPYPQFISGSVAIAKQVSELGSLRAISGIGKKVRRANDEVENETRSPSTSKKSKGSDSEPSAKHHTHTHTVTTSTDKVSLYKMKIDTLVALGASAEKITEARLQLLEELERSLA